MLNDLDLIENETRIKPREVSSYVEKAALLRQQKGPEESLKVLIPLLPRHPDQIPLRYELSIASREAGNLQASLEHLDAILVKQPRHKWALLGRVKTLMQAGRQVEAFAAIDNALNILPENIDLLVRKGAMLRQFRGAREALDFLLPLLSHFPDNISLRREVSVAFQETGNLQASLEHIDAILARQPQHKWALLGRAKTLMQVGRQVEAIEAIDNALNILPENANLLVRKGALLRQLRDAGEALEFLTPLVSRYPDMIPLHHEISVALRETGDFQASQKHLDAILAKQPDHKWALLGKVRNLIQDGREDELMLVAEDLASRIRNSLPDQAGNITEAALGPIKEMPDKIAEYLLKEFSSASERCARALPVMLLWNAYEKAETLGLGYLYRGAIEGILSRNDLRAFNLVHIIKSVTKGGIREAERLVQRLSGLLGDSERPLFDMEMGGMTGKAKDALHGRPRDPHDRSVAEVLSISRLLQQSGRLHVAARYLGMARRKHPSDLTLFREHIVSLTKSGQMDIARRELEKVDQPSFSRSRAWTIAMAVCWYEMGCPARTMELLETLQESGKLKSHFEMRLRSLIRLGRLDAAVDLVKDNQSAQSANSNPHFFSTLAGLVAADCLLSRKHEKNVSLTTPPAILTIERWLSSTSSRVIPADSGSVRHEGVMQYWNKGTPPAYLREIMQTWQKAFCQHYQLFDQKAALKFLTRHLGKDWADALRNAASPAEESDYFRLCYLMIQGGIYADCDDWLVGDPYPLTRLGSNLVVYQEPGGVMGNNVIAAPPGHPAIVWAAVAAKKSLEERHNDSTWSKTGPGLLTRAVAQHIRRRRPGTNLNLVVEPRWKLGTFVQFHTPLPYKRSKSYWNSGGARRNFPVFMELVGR